MALAAVPAAQGGFEVTLTRAHIIQGSYAGDDQVTFLARNDGLGQPPGTSKFIALDVTMAAYSSPAATSGPADGHLFIHSYDADPHFNDSGLNDDADLANMGDHSIPLSYIRGGPAQASPIALTNPSIHSPDDVGTPDKNPTPYTDGQSLSQFQVIASASLTTGGTNAIRPAPFAFAVVPQTETVVVSGRFGAELGDPVFFPTTASVPLPDVPPTGLGLAITVLVALAVSRRRIS